MLNRIVFWEPSVSPHKEDLFSAISRLMPDVEVIVMAETDLLPSRRAMGWAVKEPNGYKQIIAPTPEQCISAVSEDPKKSLHVFSGMRHVPSIVSGLKAVRRFGSNFGLMSEPRVGEGFLGALRYLQSWLTESWLRRNASFVLAIGRNGPPWFNSVGYSNSIVFPFAYFIDQSQSAESDIVCKREVIRVGYLGRLVQMKGVHNLIAAVSMLKKETVELCIAGSGEMEQELRLKADLLGVSVKFIGTIPMSDTNSFLSDLDILVLPSIAKDGWGVVVSEALLAGTPVIATTCVGASLVLNDKSRGFCVLPNTPLEICEAIEALIVDSKSNPKSRLIRKKWAFEHLSAEAGAKFFVRLIKHKFYSGPRPVDFFAD